MSHTKIHPKQPAGHVLVPAAAIGGLSVLLAAGLELLDILASTNTHIAATVSRNGMERFPKHLPDWSIWLAAAILAFGLTAAILATPGSWRRMILWITATVLVAAWAPVLSLASYAPDISAPWIATLWAGVCAIVYSTIHRMPADETH